VSTLTGAPHGTTETGAAYTEAAARVQALAEANAPARLLGVAQVGIETALRLSTADEIRTHLAEILGLIKPVAA
jgi:hypothetical protein